MELSINDAIYRIQRDYKRTNGEIYLSFSGGKDSTVLAELIKMAELPTKIPFVFSNTGIELDATLRFVKQYDYENIVFIKPRKPFAKVLKDYGYPAISKIRAKHLSTFQRHRENPFDFMTTKQLITGISEKTGKKSRFALAKKHFNFLHPDQEYKVANMCCEYMKKLPFYDYEKETGMKGKYTGMRVAEGGIRSIALKSCVSVKVKKGVEYISSHPIFDWTDEMIEEFIKMYDVPLSDAYNIYGLDRTGCVGCPFNTSLAHELEMIYNYEPLKYKAALHWLKYIYMDQGIELLFDQEYTQEYKERKEVIEARRAEMLEHYKEFRR